MTIKSGTGQACAACKYQRRRCTPECLLAPFFPADQPKMFQNVHRLFGVKNIQNLLKELGPDQNQKAMAMKSIKFHATMRDKYPVYGCLWEVHQLNWQIQMAQEELQAVLQQLAYYRQQQQQNQQQEMSPTDDYISELQLGMAPPRNGPLQLVVQDENNQRYSGFNGGGSMAYADSGNVDFGINYLEFKDSNNNNNNSLTFSNSNENNHMMIPQGLKQETGHHHDYNEMQPFFDSIDDTHSYIGSKDACESSLESSFKDSRAHLVEEMDENELKSAASGFSLISLS